MKKTTALALALAMVLTLLVGIPFTAMAGSSVCEINGVGYSSIRSAISAVPTGGTTPTVIKLLGDITNIVTSFANDAVISNQKITFDLNGFNLRFENALGSGRSGLSVRDGAVVDYKGSGSFVAVSKVNTTGYAALSVEGPLVPSSCTLTGIINGMGNVVSNGIIAKDDSTVVVNGDVEWPATVVASSGANVTINGTAYEVRAGGVGTIVTINGDASITPVASNYGAIVINGNILASIGARAYSGGSVTVNGTMTTAASTYVRLGGGNTDKSQAGYTTPTTKTGYLTYELKESSFTSSVWVQVFLPAITTANLPDGSVGTTYNQTLTADKGNAPAVTYAVASGTLPTGMTLSAAGLISGVPTAPGMYIFTVKVTNALGDSTKALAIDVSAMPRKPTITTTALPAGKDGTPYLQALQATGDADITWSLALGTLPTGLSLSANGEISGTPTQPGTYSFAVKAENNVGDHTVTLSIVVDPTPPVVTTSTLPNGLMDTAYSQTLVATGTAPITWTVDSGALPAGLSLSTAGVISGTPTVSGTYNVTVKANNAGGSVTKAYALLIVRPVTITTLTMPNATADKEYSQQLAATGDGPITWTLNNGTLPIGLTLSPQGLISGTPIATGTFQFTVAAANAASRELQSLSVVVDAVPPLISGPGSQTLAVGYAAAQSAVFTLSGTAPITVTLQGDSKITWNASEKKLNIAAGLAVGTYPVTLTAANGGQPDATFTFTLTVVPAFTVTGVSVSSATAETLQGGTQQFTATVSGTGSLPQGVVWRVTGAQSANTTISIAGLLTVGRDETAPTLTVTATSTGDGTQEGAATVTVLPLVAPGIAGPTGLSVEVGYAKISTDAYIITGTPTVTVTITQGPEQISWNPATRALDIESGLAAGTYTVELKAESGVQPAATFTFTLTVAAHQHGENCIKLGDASLSGWDKALDIDDILAVRAHMFGQTLLTGKKLYAADISKSGTIDIDVILAIRGEMFGGAPLAIDCGYQESIHS